MTTQSETPDLMIELARLEDFIATHRASVENASPDLPQDWNTMCDQMALVNGLIARTNRIPIADETK
jgi:hypothetical protein